MKRLYFVSVFMGIFLVSGCSAYNTYGGADVAEARRLSVGVTENLGIWQWLAYGSSAYEDPIIATLVIPPMLHLSYGINDIADVSLHGALYHLAGEFRACVYRSEKRKRGKTPYWVATADIGGALAMRMHPDVWNHPDSSGYHVLVYPGVTFGAVGSNLEGYGRIRYYHSLTYSKGPLVDPHFGIGGGLLFKAGPWKGLVKRVVSPWEFTMIFGRLHENDRFLRRGLDIGGGLGIQF